MLCPLWGIRDREVTGGYVSRCARVKRQHEHTLIAILPLLGVDRSIATCGESFRSRLRTG